MDRCILVATDGEAHSLGALVSAKGLADGLRLPLEAVHACELNALFGEEPVRRGGDLITEVAAAVCATGRKRIEAQLEAAGIDARTPLHLEVGDPATAIARTAVDRGAAVIVVGRGSPATSAWLPADEPLLRLMQSSHVPILATPAECDGLPTRMLAAIDFTSYSLDAARTGARLLPPGGELHLVHVATDPSSIDLTSWREAEWMRAMRSDTEDRLKMLAAEITRAHPRLRVVVHLVEGRPAEAVLDLADELGVDALAAGTNGYGFLGRLLLGSVATQLVRRAHCTTLIAPPRDIVPAASNPVPGIWRRRRVAAGR